MLQQELKGVNSYDPVLRVRLLLRKICQTEYGFSLTHISPDDYRTYDSVLIRENTCRREPPYSDIFDAMPPSNSSHLCCRVECHYYLGIFFCSSSCIIESRFKLNLVFLTSFMLIKVALVHLSNSNSILKLSIKRLIDLRSPPPPLSLFTYNLRLSI